MSNAKDRTPIFNRVSVEVERVGIRADGTLVACGKPSAIAFNLDSPLISGVGLTPMSPSAEYRMFVGHIPAAGGGAESIEPNSGAGRIGPGEANVAAAMPADAPRCACAMTQPIQPGVIRSGKGITIASGADVTITPTGRQEFVRPLDVVDGELHRALAKSHRELGAKAQQLDDEVRRLKSELEGYQLDVRSLKSRKASLLGANDELRSEIAELKQEVEAHERGKAELLKAFADKTEELERRLVQAQEDHHRVIWERGSLPEVNRQLASEVEAHRRFRDVLVRRIRETMGRLDETLARGRPRTAGGECYTSLNALVHDVADGWMGD